MLETGPGGTALLLLVSLLYEQILWKREPLVSMGTSDPHLVRNLPRPGTAHRGPSLARPGRAAPDPGLLRAGGVLISHEAVDLIECQGFHLSWANDQPQLM